jgi:hypothetical protein
MQSRLPDIYRGSSHFRCLYQERGAGLLITDRSAPVECAGSAVHPSLSASCPKPHSIPPAIEVGLGHFHGSLPPPAAGCGRYGHTVSLLGAAATASPRLPELLPPSRALHTVQPESRQTHHWSSAYAAPRAGTIKCQAYSTSLHCAWRPRISAVVRLWCTASAPKSSRCSTRAEARRAERRGALPRKEVRLPPRQSPHTCPPHVKPAPGADGHLGDNATRDAHVDIQIWAKGAHICQLNVVEVKEYCNFHGTSFLCYRQLTIAIGNGGTASPCR